jgi:hypothetical protein
MSGFLMFSIGSGKWSEAGRKGSLCWFGVKHTEPFQDRLDVVFLRDVEFPVGPVSEDVEPEKVRDRSSVRALKSVVEFGLEVVQFLAIVAGDELVINVDGEDEKCILGWSDVETGVGRRRIEIERSKELVKSLIEAARWLFETVKWFLKSKNLVGRDVAAFRRFEMDEFL